MNTLVYLVEKIEFEVLNNKGHRHLYNKFDEIMLRLKSGEGKTDEEQRALESAISLLAFEGDVFTGFPGYNFYVVRCYYCAFRLFEFVHDECRKQWLQSKLDRFFTKIKECHLTTYLPKELFEAYNRQLWYNSKTGSVLELTRQCFECCDAGRRPHEYYKEKEMYDNFIRGFRLVKEYLERTHDYERIC